MSKCDSEARVKLEEYLASNKITVMSTIGCPSCVDAKKLLNKHSFNYLNVDLTDDSNENLFHCLYDITKSHYVPQIFVNNKFIGGYRELQYLHTTGILHDLYNI